MPYLSVRLDRATKQAHRGQRADAANDQGDDNQPLIVLRAKTGENLDQG
jgi:hypothetical protein